MRNHINRRITIVISNLSGGGAERVACNLANYLDKQNYDVEVITTLSGNNDTYKLSSGIKRYKLMEESDRRGKLYNSFMKIRRLKKYIKDNQDIDCYVVFLPINTFLMLRFMKYTKSKVIFTERNNPSSLSLMDRLIMKSGAKKADGFVVQTKEIYEYYTNICNKMIIIPNAINPDATVIKKRKSKNKIVAVGRLAAQKNYPMVIESFKKFIMKHPEYTLEIFGQGGEKEKLEQLVKEYRLDGKVFFRGYVNDVTLQMSDAACFVMASNYEGMPNALIEAMCMGIPCVATDCDGGGVRELISNMENGIMVKKNDVAGMVEGMCKIVEDEKFRKAVSENAILLKNQLEPDRIYGKWRSFIEEVVLSNE